MKYIIKLLTKFKLFKILYISIIILSIENTVCVIKEEELSTFFEDMTIDRIRQIYWNIVVDINNISTSSLGEYLLKKDVADTLHSFTRAKMINILYESLKRLSSLYPSYYFDINLLKENLPNIEVFYNTNLNIFPRNFLINFAINIDKYIRTKERKIDGITDYINYLTKEKIIEYIQEKMDEYSDLKKYYSNIVLNNKTLVKDVKIYINNTYSTEELIQIIYGFENYLFNEENNSEISFYKYYDHEELNTKDVDNLKKYVTMYNLEANIENIDDFISKIEYRNFKYISNYNLFNRMSETEFNNDLLALEKYYRRQMNLTKYLRGINEYTKNMPERYKKKNLEWGFNLYPELYISGMFQDIISNEINYQYGQVKEYIQITERNILLRYAYNIHTYQNNIESIYDDSLYNLFRYKNEKLYELILSDTNLNKNLQVKSNFINFADLYKDYFCKYLENLQRNQLKKITKILIDLYFKEKQSKIDSYQKPSEKLSRLEFIMNSDTADILYESENFVNTTDLEIQSTSKFFELNKELIDSFGYYNNIIDFLRSTNLFYLKLWLRKYEMIFRNKNLYMNIDGGLQNRFLSDDENTKKDILEIFDIYLEEYPELFEPKKFIDIVGLNNDITPHKKLVELFDNIEHDNNREIIMKICYSLTGHYQRKNIQTSFNIKQFISELSNNLYDKNENYNKYLFQLFRIINIFPELSNSKSFEYICINNDTRVISLYEDNYFAKYCNRDKKKIAKNIQYYLNSTNNYDHKNIDNMGPNELSKYISGFLDDPSFLEDYDLKSRILDGDFDPIIYNYFENYLNTIDETHLNFIFNNIKLKCSENYPCQKESNASDIYEKKKEIINDIKNVEEFQNPNYFDKYFDYILGRDGDKLYEFLVNSTNKNLKLYTIMANIYKTIQKKDNNIINNLPEDIYFKIHYMSRNEMIRYILKINEIYEDMINADMLPILTRYYMLDIGSENVYDLSLY